ncbi:Glucose-responsive transcription factor [Emydomyces testavorans]|uniref:Glucose-responsive transcription factor n=1 Tax=Emydomyces testavorans TaxID=2070801 RepID=A0AAF0DGG1_9EURO|nr:Glucose-responsive transcription factor [Emydomyces testavorans]
MSERVSTEYGAQEQDPLSQQTHRTDVAKVESVAMATREHSDMPQAPSYPSPNATQVNQGTVSYYTNQRQLTAEELHLSAELSREVSGTNIHENSANGIGQGQPIVLGSPNPNASVNRGGSADQQPQHQQHLVQFPPNQQSGVDPNHDLSYGDQSARRKRTKVSRACDECRRKKIQPGVGNQPDVHYQALNEDGSPVARGYQEFSPTVDNLLPRKRTYSMSEGVTAAMGLPANQETRQPSVGGWSTQPQTKDTRPDALAGIDVYAAQNGAARVGQPFWSQATTGAEPAEGIVPVEIHEKVLDADKLYSHLRQASRQVQEVFLHSLFAVTGAGSFRAGNQFQEIPTFDKAQDRLYEWFRGDPSSRPLAANFILLHSIILMILEADQRGRQNFRGQSGIPKATLVEGSVSLGYYIAKPLRQLDISNPDDKDVDSDGNLARRNWIVIGILARWHMLSTAGPDFFGNHEIATPEDNNIVNLATLQLARYSTLFTEIYETFHESFTNPTYGVSRAFKKVISGQLTRIRDIERLDLANTDAGTIHNIESFSPLVFWSIHLLLKRHLYIYVPAELIYPSQVLIEIMKKQTESPTPISSPFHFHFLALAIITLLELMDIHELVDDVQEILDKALGVISLREKHAATAGEFEKIFATQEWENTFRLFVEARKNQMRQERPANQQLRGASQPLGATEQRSLQHLADLAVGAGGKPGSAPSPPTTSSGNVSSENKEAMSNMAPGLEEHKEDYPLFIDFTELTRKGYLNVFAGTYT